MRNRIVDLAFPSAFGIADYCSGSRCELSDGCFNVVSSEEDAKKYDNSQFEMDVLAKYDVLSETPLIVAHHDSIAVQLQFEDLIGRSSSEILNINSQNEKL